jgi:hypothetical protein
MKMTREIMEATLSPLSLRSTTSTDVGKMITFVKVLYLNSVNSSTVIIVCLSRIHYMTHFKDVTISGHNVAHIECHGVPSTFSVSMVTHTETATKIIQFFLTK